jgi:hypothetical protein
VRGVVGSAIEKATGGQVSVNQDGLTIKSGVGGLQMGNTDQWPSQIPPDVPRFTSGKIFFDGTKTVVATGQATGERPGQGIMMMFNSVPSDSFEKYQNDLKNAGWTIGIATQNAGGFMFAASRGRQAIMATFEPTGKKEFSGEITYIQGQ